MSHDLALARMIAHMIAPEREVPGYEPPESNEYTLLLDACVRHKIPLLSLDLDVPDLAPFYASEAFQQALEAEHSRWQGFRDEYLLVREAFDAQGIRDVMIKAAGIAPALTYKSDNLDVLVPLELGERARQALLGLGYIELINVEEPHKFLFRKFHDTESVSAIHVHEFVGWGTGFMDDAGVHARAILSSDDDAVAIPCAEDALMITVAHAFYEDKEVKLGDLWKAMRALARGPLDWELMREQAIARGWLIGWNTCIALWSGLELALYGETSFPDEVIACTEAELPEWCLAYVDERVTYGDWPVGVSFKFSKRHYYGKVLADTTLTPGAKARDIWLHSWAGIERRLPGHRQKGMLITLSGLDGCGKTTHAEALEQVFATCDIATTRVWSRAASSRFTDAVIRLLRPLVASKGERQDATDNREAKTERKSRWLKRPLVRVGWSAMAGIDLLAQYWFRVAWPLLRGRVVIADRYVYDALVELAVLYDRTHIAESRMGRLLRGLCPTPDRAFLLDLDAETGLARKPDETVDYLKRQRFVYTHMATTWGLELVDALQPQDVVIDTITQDVLTAYYAKWRPPRLRWRG